MIRYLLDTNIVSFHLRRSSPALRRRLRRHRAAEFALSVVTELEIRFGLARNPALRIAPLVETFLAAMTIAPLDSAVARTYAQVRTELEANGEPIGALDTIIAAHALTLGAKLITNDLDDFRRVPGLVCEDWSR